MIDIQIF